MAALLGCSTNSSKGSDGERDRGSVEIAKKHEPLGISGLVAAYGFDEGAGATLHDVTGNGHDGELSGQTWVPGRFGTALRFNDNLISIDATEQLDLTTGMTLSAWVNLEGEESDWPAVVMKESPGSLSYGLWAGWVGLAPSVLIDVGSLEELSGGPQAPAGIWTYLAATYDGDTLRLYVDGNLEASLQVGEPIVPSTLPLTIGGNHWGEFLHGAIDELRIYNRALTQSEIQQDMNSAVGDGQPLVVHFVGIPEEATVSSRMQVEVGVLDSATASVQFLVDGNPIAAPQVTAPFAVTWDSTTVPNGPHTLRAEARDSEGNLLGDAEVSVVVNNALVAAYSFDEGSGTVLSDVTGNGHDAELSGQTWVDGKYGSALRFEDSFITVADSDLLDLTNGMTLSAWVKQETLTAEWPTIVMKERFGDLCYGLWGEWGEWSVVGPGVFISDDDVRHELTAAPQGIVGIWTHLAGTYDGETLRLYVNGDLATSAPLALSMAVSSLPLTIGGNGVWMEYFHGSIDDLRIYNYALSQSDIAVAMNSAVGCDANDGNPCTSDTCDPSTGQPVHTPVPAGTSCADADVCNGEETCSASGECLPGTPVVVDDSNPCIAAYCDPVLGAIEEPRPAGHPCNDGNVCNGAELCDGMGTCDPGEPPDVEDGNPCTIGSCDPELGVVQTAVAAGVSCADGDVCNGEETCDGAGSCEAGDPPGLESENPCVVLSCDPVLGIVQSAAPDGTSCDDGNACTQTDVCSSGVCTGANPIVCAASDQCQAAGACDPATGLCSGGPLPDGTSCDDGDACSQTDTCQAGSCVGSNPVLCTAFSQCHDVGSCDPATGACSTPAKADGTPCDDGDLCTVDDSCAAGVCVSGDEVVVADQPCSVGYCDAATGDVVYDPAPDGTACDDGDACSLADVCQGGACVGTDPVVCAGGPCITAGSCDPATGACSSTPLPDGTSCEDGDDCTVGDSCLAGVCASGDSLEIEDLPCQVGSCDAATGTVVYEPVAVGTACFVDACSAGECNGAGECVPSGPPPELDDGNPCTLDRCDPVLGPVHVACAPIDGTVATTVLSATEWIFSGPNPVQTGVAPGTIEARRAALLRGFVRAVDGTPLSGVKVTVHGHEELGQTTTHADGTFDMVVNGGGALQIYFHKAGYLDSSRRMDVRWNHTHTVPEVVLIEPDPIVTEIDLDPNGTDYQVAVGSLITDEDGTRQATLLFPPGVQALMHMPDGSFELMVDMHVRLTEFTVGSNGPAAMPADLPPNTGYTYAFEVNADEAVAAGAPEIEFSEPLVFYTDNFLGFPAGTVVPLGSFNRQIGLWVPHDNGVVMDVLGVDGGLALVDVTGDGVADDATALGEHGITEDERAQLGLLYPGGASLWRVGIPHFTEPYDCNWPFGFPDDATGPGEGGADGEGNFNPEPADPDSVPGDCEVDNASTLDCLSQTYRETIDIGGGPFSLHYSSGRAPARVEKNGLKIPLTRTIVPESLKRVEVTVDVGGRTFTEAYAPAPSQSVVFIWDGLDAYGRVPQGRQKALVKVAYAYDGVYGVARRFGSPGIGLMGNRTRQELYMERRWEVPIGTWRITDDVSADVSLGGWTLSPHHRYDRNTGVLYLGDGTVRDATSMAVVMENVAGEFSGSFVEGGVARRTSIPTPSGVAAAPDGSVYVCSDNNQSRLYRITREGAIQRIAGVGSAGYSGDGGPAADAQIRCAMSTLAIGPRGEVYLAEPQNRRIRRIDVNGIITTVVGNGTVGFSGDGGPATDAQLGSSRCSVAAAPDGSLYIADQGNSRLRHVGVDGIIETIAGTGAATTGPPDGAVALTSAINPMHVTVDYQGIVYVMHTGGAGVDTNVVYSLGADGRWRHLAGCRTSAECRAGIGIPAKEARFWGGAPDTASVAVDGMGQVHVTGNVSIAPFTSGQRLMTIGRDGVLRAPIGFGGVPYRSGNAAVQTSVFPSRVAAGPEGLIIVHDGGRVTRLSSPLPGITPTEQAIASEDGRELYFFDLQGRHLRTVHALTQAVLYDFEYDAAGRLVAIHDHVGRTTRVERDAGGHPKEIIGPYGQRTALTVQQDGYLATVRNPELETYTLSYHDGGLLATFEDPAGGISTMTYDEVGRISVDQDAASAPMSLARTDLSGGWSVTRSTPLGRATTYRTQKRADGSEARTNTFADATQAAMERDETGSLASVLPDGTEVDVVATADPRWGMSTPVLSTTTRLPSGLTRVATATRTTTQSSSLDPMTLTSQTDTTVVNGRTYRTVYTASDRTFVTTSPQNRTVRRVIDDFGRTVSTRVGNLAPIDFIYDADGRLESITQSGRLTQYGYFNAGPAEGMLGSITDALGTSTTMTRDAVGRVLTETRGPATTAFGWDVKGNLTSVTPPGQDEHLMSYTPVNLLASYEPPPLSGSDWSTQYAWDLDRQLTTEARPNGTVIGHQYDTAGRLWLTTSPTGNVQRAYYGPSDTCVGCAPGRLAAMLGPYGVELSFGYDGQLKTSESWSGAVAGDVAWSYNADFVATSETVFDAVGAQSVAFGYDNDLLLTCASPTSCSPVSADALRLTRHSQHGMVTQLLQGSVTENWTYNTFGELSSQVVTASGSPLVAFQYNAASAPRDALGRITEKAETFAGTTKRIGYTYDVMGRLTDVTIDDVLTEHYEYDLNGNRLLGQTADGSFIGQYDAQDRLLSYGDYEYTYGANGELFTKTDTSTNETTAYTYDAFGSLIAVELPDATLIEYVTDGKHRRVGKKVDGVLVKQWLYRDQLNPVAELDGAGNLVAQFVYGSRGHVPDFMVRDGEVYRIVSDQVGSVRLVVNADDVSDVLFRAEYTAFGEMTVLEGDVEATPFGFAGGLFDADTGLTRFGARDYDPVVGRWTAKDPLRFRGSRMSLYSYSQNDPVNRFDPTGEVDDPVTSPYREYVDAFESAERLFPGGGPGGGSGGMGDAYRHCRASCKLAQKWGNAYSRVCGWLNEVAGGNDAGDRLMDDINNAIGRSYGVEGADCSLACYSAAKRGVLVTFGQ